MLRVKFVHGEFGPRKVVHWHGKRICLHNVAQRLSAMIPQHSTERPARTFVIVI